MTEIPTIRFSDGHSIPQLGYGVWQVEDEVAADVVEKAIAAGFRHIDTAAIYGNEEGTGRAIAASGVPREDLFITTKLWNDSHDRDAALAGIDTSLGKLGLDFVDLYLVHWAKPLQNKYVEAWKALIEIQQAGKARSIGVSNHPEEQLREIIDATGVTPAIHQIELHPYHQQKELRAIHEELGIVTEAYSPLGSTAGAELSDPVITEIAQKHDASSAQVIIAWHLAQGIVVIPKSVTASRIVENFAAADLMLAEDEVEAINALDKGVEGRIGADPKTITF
ncbi:aldo/keto reductase [Brachybacterium sp. Marseille-Q7125]|uniref:aldo/keto reductase n=1 Tax=Brachybacterium sp. Marseille-Q7125 TaxID=2932815 RepID=UPI001FF3B7D5|nr:aldo/keto reductase [Brachybacterium sp. Marseille-Q7125]